MKALRRIPVGWRWATLGAFVALAATLVWVFFLRGSEGAINRAPTTQTAVPTRPAAGRTISFDEYTAALDAALSRVQRARSVEGNGRQEAVESAVRELESVEGASVTSPREGSAPAEVDNSALIASLKGDAPDLEGIEHSLTALLVSLDAEGSEAGPEGVLGGEEASGKLDEVLQDPAFDYERELSPLQRLARWLASLTGEADPESTLWRWFLSVVAGLALGVLTFLLLDKLVPNRWARLLLSVIAGVLGALVFYVVSGAIGATVQLLGAVGLVVAAIAAALILMAVKRGGSAPTAPEKKSDLSAVLGMGAAEARRRAEEAAAGGNYRAAIRYRCLGVLLALDEADMLHFDRAATNREYLFRAPGDLQGQLQPLLAQFGSVWYGNAGATEGEWREYDARAGAIEAKVVMKGQAKQAA